MNGVVHPNLFLAGAPKCGTTSLAGWLAAHPDVFMPREKEPSHFYHPNQTPISYATYLELFRAGAGRKYILDASIWYMFSPVAIRSINSLYPESRFLICLRNPVDMFFSLHKQKLYSGQELIRDPADAWNASFLRAQGQRIGVRAFRDIDVTHMAYNLSCALGTQVSDLLDIIPRSRVHFVLFEDLQSRPRHVFDQLCRWLEIHSSEDVDLDWKNRAKMARFDGLRTLMLYGSKLKRKITGSGGSGMLAGLQRLNSIEGTRGKIDQRLREQVTNYFVPEIENLEHALGVPLQKWRG